MVARLKAIIAIVLVFTCLFAAAVLAANYVLSKQLKSWATGLSRSELGKEICISSLKVNILKGISIKGLVIKTRDKVVLQADEAKARFTLLPLLSGRFLVTKISIHSPIVLLQRYGDGSWNFDEFFASVSHPASATRKMPFTLVIEKAEISNAMIRLVDLSAPGTPTRLSAAVDARVSTAIRGNNIRLIIDAAASMVSAKTATAEASGKMTVSGELTLRAGKPATWSGGAWVSGITVSRPERFAGLKLTGPVRFDQAQTSWSKVTLEYAGNAYTSSGVISNYAAPRFELGVYSPRLKLETQAETGDKTLELKRLDISFINSELSAVGSIDLSSAGLPCRLACQSRIELEDLGQSGLIPADALQRLKPSGRVDATIEFSGALGDIAGSTATAVIKSREFSLSGFHGKNLAINYKQEKGTGEAFVNCVAYEGLVNLKADVDLKRPAFPFTVGGSIEGVKIEQLKLDTPAKDKNLSGSLTISANFSGDTRESANLQGSGTVSMDNGNLWQLDILAGLGQLLFPELGTLTFNKGYADFTVNECHVRANLALANDMIKLAGKADIGFDGAVDSRISVQVNNQLVPKLGKLRQLTGIIFNQTGHFIGARITGNLQKPRYTLTQPIIDDITRGVRALIKVIPGKRQGTAQRK